MSYFVLYLCLHRLNEEDDKPDTISQISDRENTTRLQFPEKDIQIKYDIQDDTSDGDQSSEKKCTVEFSTPPQLNCQNQLCVENPANFKNDDIHEFIIGNTDVQKDGKESSSYVENNGEGKITPPALPTRGILKRGKKTNKSNEDKTEI